MASLNMEAIEKCPRPAADGDGPYSMAMTHMRSCQEHEEASEHGPRSAVWPNVSVGGGAKPFDMCSNKDVDRSESETPFLVQQTTGPRPGRTEDKSQMTIKPEKEKRK